jgi:dienelactone hydrolase
MRKRFWVLGLQVVAVLLAGCAGSSPPTDPTPSWPRLLDVTPGSQSTQVPPDFEALPGARAHFGKIDQAVFRIEIPVHWNGELLLWAHGVRGFGPEVSAETPPAALRRALIEQGYAWAASSFSENGFVPGIGTNDTLTLKRYFARQFGRPRRTYIAGSSMGGNIVTLSLENFPEEYDGGLSLCGVVAGEEWIDYLVAWVMAAEFVAGFELPLDQGSASVTEVLESKVLPALGPVEAPTLPGRAFESVIRNLTGGPRPFFVEGYRKAYPFNFGLVTGDPGRVMASTRAATNEGVDYRADPGLGLDNEVLNRAVRRLPADPALRDPAKHPDTAPTTGQLRSPLLTLHETGDLTVPISAEQSYRKKAEAAGNGDLLVQRIIRSGSHCEFSDAEITRAWNDLAQWVAGDQKPEGDDVLADLSDAGRTFTNPVRPNDPGNRK